MRDTEGRLATKLTPKQEALLFIAMLLDKNLRSWERNRLVKLWNEDHKRREKK